MVHVVCNMFSMRHLTRVFACMVMVSDKEKMWISVVTCHVEHTCGLVWTWSVHCSGIPNLSQCIVPAFILSTPRGHYHIHKSSFNPVHTTPCCLGHWGGTYTDGI
jgi:hypothetical protein